MDSPTARQLASELESFLRSVRLVWSRYLERGPGQLQPQDFEPVATAQDELRATIHALAAPTECLELADGSAATLVDLVRQAGDFARRCSCTPQGLSFITGEAGLIPRKDQHAAFERTLDALQTWLERFESMVD